MSLEEKIREQTTVVDKSVFPNADYEMSQVLMKLVVLSQ